MDTSALAAVSFRERGREQIQRALVTESGLVPAPVLVELRRVTALAGNKDDPDVTVLIEEMLAAHVRVEPFSHADAILAASANEAHGTGNGRGGTLNLLDLMVYGMARRTGRPILCTGRDFAATDALLHPASRVG